MASTFNNFEGLGSVRTKINSMVSEVNTSTTNITLLDNRVTDVEALTTAIVGGTQALTTGTVTGAFTIGGNLAVDTNTLFVNSSNNRVGINTTTPSYTLDVVTPDNANANVQIISGTTSGTLAQLFMRTQNTDGDCNIYFGDASNSTAGWVRYAHANNSLFLGTSNAHRLTVNSVGHVGVNTTTPSYNLQVNGDAYVTGQLLLKGGGTSSPGLCFINDAGKDSGLFYSSDGLVRVCSNGNHSAYFQNTNFYCYGNVTAYSDERLKDDIETIDGALDKVCAMRGVMFTREGNPGTGVIAQEVERIMPEVVEDADGGYKTVAYGNLVGVLIEAIKELKAEIEELKGAR